MKYLSSFLLLTLLIVVVFSSDIFDHRPDHHKCLKRGDKGYTTYFLVNSWNSYIPGPKGQLVQASFYEYGTISVDFKNQRMRIDFNITGDHNGDIGNIGGSLWAFQSNKTLYIKSWKDGSCSQYPLTFDVPDGYPKNITTWVREVRIGKFKCQEFSITPQAPYTNVTSQRVLYDTKGCAVVSSYAKNVNSSNPGFMNAEYFDFKNHPTESLFDLPSACGASDDNEMEIEKPRLSILNQKIRRLRDQNLEVPLSLELDLASEQLKMREKTKEKQEQLQEPILPQSLHIISNIGVGSTAYLPLTSGESSDEKDTLPKVSLMLNPKGIKLEKIFKLIGVPSDCGLIKKGETKSYVDLVTEPGDYSIIQSHHTIRVYNKGISKEILLKETFTESMVKKEILESFGYHFRDYWSNAKLYNGDEELSFSTSLISDNETCLSTLNLQVPTRDVILDVLWFNRIPTYKTLLKGSFMRMMSGVIVGVMINVAILERAVNNNNQASSSKY
eukprot:gene8486-10430_t